MSISIEMNDLRPSPRRLTPPPLQFVEEAYLHPRQQTFALYKAKLSGVIRLMALIGGFCVSSVAELKGHETAEPWLVTLFTVVTVLLTSMAAFVILFTASLLPYMTANEELDTVLLETELIHRFKSHRVFCLSREIQIMVQVTWLMASTGTVFLFLLDMILITWIKFQKVSATSAVAGTSVISPTILLMIYFAIRFWRELLQRQLFGPDFRKTEDDELDDVEYLSRVSMPNVKRKLSDGLQQQHLEGANVQL